MSVSTPDDTIIGRNVRTHRERRGLTQAELGGRIGVTFQQVQKYERGVNRVAASRLCLIAQALDVSVADLLDQPLNDAHPVAVMAFKEPRYDVTSDALKAVIDHIGMGRQAEVVSDEKVVCTIKIVPPSPTQEGA